MKLASVHLVGMVVLASSAAPKAEKAGGLFAPLEKGQKVALKETAHGFEIGVVPGVDLGFTIKHISKDFIVLEDPADVTETRIPIYSNPSAEEIKRPFKPLYPTRALNFSTPARA